MLSLHHEGTNTEARQPGSDADVDVDVDDGDDFDQADSSGLILKLCYSCPLNAKAF